MLSPLRSSSSKTAGSTLLGHVSINLSDIACIRLWNNAVIDAKSGKRKTVMPGKTDFSDNVDTIWPWERFFLILKNGEYYNFAADSQNDLENFILGLQYLLLLDSPKQDLLDLSSHRWTRTKISWYRAFTKTLILNKAANQS